MPRRPIIVANIADGGLIYWIVRLYLFALAGTLALALALGVGVYIYFVRETPVVPDFSATLANTPSVTKVYGQEGSLIAEFATEWREIVPFEKIPPSLVHALLATEDRRFYEHHGLDLRGMVRALFTNVRAGDVVEGGSTITQQVAKSFLSPERTFSRKLKEAILARRLESQLSKRQILELYLNRIFLGNGAYGVQAAAKRYFDKNVWEIDLGEAALIAGLARAPSRYNPAADMAAAQKRKREVLKNLVETGHLSSTDAEKWNNSEIVLHARKDILRERSAYFAEHIRRQLAQQLGSQAIYEGGLRVETTLMPWLDLAAQENVDHATRKLDKRQGWRGPEMHLSETEIAPFRKAAAELYGEQPLIENRLYLGLVQSVTGNEARILVGQKIYPLPLRNALWASAYSAHDSTNDRLASSLNAVLKTNDVVWVKWAFTGRVRRFSDYSYNELGETIWQPERTAKKAPAAIELALEQPPRIQGALYTIDHRTGYVLAMVGGSDPDRSIFNRVTQACRQPGSAYKPIYYSLALDRGYSYGTIWSDKLKPELDPVTGETWIPQNIDGSYGAQVSFERALVWSKNPPSVEIFRTLGSEDVEAWAHQLGIRSPLITSPKCETQFCSSLALGASCLHADEITHAFATFARDGVSLTPISIRRVTNRQGQVLIDRTSHLDPWLRTRDKLNRIAAEFGRPQPQAISPRTAYLTSKLLREVVTHGHSGPIRATKIPCAGKTGTSSHTSDVWFIGYTQNWMTTAWMGDDTYQRQLGFHDASFMLSVPLWTRYMVEAVQDRPLGEVPDVPPANVRENDTGGPLKKGFPPPPLSLKPSAASSAQP